MDRIRQPTQIPRRRLAKFSLAAAIVVVICTSVACSDDAHNAAANTTTNSAAHGESPAAQTPAARSCEHAAGGFGKRQSQTHESHRSETRVAADGTFQVGGFRQQEH